MSDMTIEEKADNHKQRILAKLMEVCDVTSDAAKDGFASVFQIQWNAASGRYEIASLKLTRDF